MSAIDLAERWQVPHVAAAVLDGTEVVATTGDRRHRFRLASISKPIVAWATLIAVEEGTLSLDSPVGQPGCTVRHLLAHAGGYAFDGDEPIAPPARTRIYSNTGFELLAEALAAAASLPFERYLRESVFEPLAMTSSQLVGSPAHGIHAPLDDVIAFVAEVARPTLLDGATVADAVRPQYPELSGIVPGVGRFERCPWGLGFELRGGKSPHWTGSHNSASTFGHFGGAGTMFWVDPEVDTAVVALTDRDFGPWALEAWPELSDAVLAERSEAMA